MRYDYVMVDSGCNSILLPFKEECTTRFSGEKYQWKIVQSRGVDAVKSPTLIITIHGGVSPLGSMILAGSEHLLPMKYLRFHLGTESACRLRSHAKLSDTSQAILAEFLTSMGDRVCNKRRHVVLGQAYLKEVLSLQLGGILMMGNPAVFPTCDDFNRVLGLLEPLRDDFPEFDALEDEDHDGDADEEYIQYDDIDEPGDECME